MSDPILFEPQDTPGLPYAGHPGAISNAQIAAVPIPAPIRFGDAITERPGFSVAVVVGIAIFIIGAALWFMLPTAQPLTGRMRLIVETLGKLLLSPPDEAKPVILAMLAFATTTLYCLRTDSQVLRSEKLLLETLRNHTHRIDIGDDRFARGLQDQLSHCLATSPLVRAVQAVWDARNLQTPDLEAISTSLDGLAASRSTRGRTMGNRLMLLSLFGTIIGLSSATSTLGAQLGSPGADVNISDLLTNLQGTLATMGTAFASTAWGIVLALLLAWYAGIVNDAWANHIAEIQYFAIAELAPRLFPHSLPQAVAHIEGLVLRSEAFVAESRLLLDETRKRNIDYMIAMDSKSRESAERTANVTAGIEKTIRDAAKEVHDALASAGNHVVKGAKAQIDVAKQLDRLLGESTSHMQNAADDIKTSLQGLSNSAGVVQASHKALAAAVVDLKTSLDGQAKAIGDVARTHIAEADKLVVSNHGAYKKMADQTTSQINTLANELKEFLKRADPKLPSAQQWDALKDTIERCTKAAEGFADATRSIKNVQQDRTPGVTSGELERILERLSRDISDRIGTVPVGVREDLRGLREDLQRTLRTLDNQTRPSSAIPSQRPYMPGSETSLRSNLSDQRTEYSPTAEPRTAPPVMPVPTVPTDTKPKSKTWWWRRRGK